MVIDFIDVKDRIVEHLHKEPIFIAPIGKGAYEVFPLQYGNYVAIVPIDYGFLDKTIYLGDRISCHVYSPTDFVDDLFRYDFDVIDGLSSKYNWIYKNAKCRNFIRYCHKHLNRFMQIKPQKVVLNLYGKVYEAEDYIDQRIYESLQRAYVNLEFDWTNAVRFAKNYIAMNFQFFEGRNRSAEWKDIAFRNTMKVMNIQEHKCEFQKNRLYQMATSLEGELIWTV